MGLDRVRKTFLRRAAASLRAWRAGADLSTTQAADRLGVPQQVWASWEGGERRPSFANALLLEDLTSGAVRFETWDYPRALVTTLRAAVARRVVESVVAPSATFAGEG